MIKLQILELNIPQSVHVYVITILLHYNRETYVYTWPSSHIQLSSTELSFQTEC